LCLSKYLYKETGLKYLTIAGGVGLNCVTNNYLSENGPFEEIYIQPAANDAGTAMGACYYLWNQVLDNKERYLQETVYLGPEYSESEIESVLTAQKVQVSKHDNIQRTVAELLANGEVVAWFQGQMEFGPRALGNRSILADPRRVDMANYLNEKIKHREFFRPFAASILEEKTNEWFDIKKSSFSDKFMLLSRMVNDKKIGLIPAVTHYDNTCRIQTVGINDNQKYYKLIQEFEKLTDVPLLLNTSFNDSEPIICSPMDALNTCIKADIRWLAVGDFLVDLANSSLTSIDKSNNEERKAELVFANNNEIEVDDTPMQMVFRSR
jgi:carbamoyltransferase